MLHLGPLVTAAVLLAPLLVLAKSSDNSSQRLAKYRALAKKNGGVINLDTASYDDLTDGPRDFSITILLTALGDQFNCAPCRCVDLRAS